MDVFETDTQSFIVKIWVDESTEVTGELIWCGQITHVLSGERFDLQSLDDIGAFMNSYLQDVDRPGQLDQR